MLYSSNVGCSTVPKEVSEWVELALVKSHGFFMNHHMILYCGLVNISVISYKEHSLLLSSPCRCFLCQVNMSG